MARPISLLIPTLLMFAGWTAWAGCAENYLFGSGATHTGTGGAAGGGAADGGQAAAGNTGNTGGRGGAGGWGAGGHGGGLPDGDICDPEQIMAERLELDMFLVVDISGSMSGYHWTLLRDALISFFEAPPSAGVNIGLNLFPPSGTQAECDPAYYEPIQHPSSIPPLYDLPQDSAELSAILMPIEPAGSTPMWAALDGTYTVAGGWASTYVDHKVIVVLMGDGSPNNCDGVHGQDEVTACASLAGAALGMDIKTYCIAIRSEALVAMMAIAQAGGTAAPHDVSDDVSQVVQVLSDIRHDALGCEFPIPTPKHQPFDVTRVNVDYYPGGIAPADQLPQADDLADCGAEAGWYFDHAITPTQIILCPASCTELMNDPAAQVNVLFGCPTVTN